MLTSPVFNPQDALRFLPEIILTIAGTMLMAQLGQGQPTIGATWILPSFAGPIIGGAALSGGSAPIIGTVLAPWRVSFGLMLGGGLSLLNYHWLRTSVGAIELREGSRFIALFLRRDE